MQYVGLFQVENTRWWKPGTTTVNKKIPKITKITKLLRLLRLLDAKILVILAILVTFVFLAMNLSDPVLVILSWRS